MHARLFKLRGCSQPSCIGLFCQSFSFGFHCVRVEAAIQGEVSIGGEGLACDRSRKYMIVWHPHGFITWVPFFIAGRYALDAQPCGEHWFPVVAPVLFRVPIFSEMLIILGARRVDKKVIDKMLARGDSIAIQPGGVKEQAQSSEKQEQAFFPARLGFVRMAIRPGSCDCG